MIEMLVSGLVGGIIGMVLESMTSILRAGFFKLRYRQICGEYTHPNGEVTISNGFGNSFLTEGREKVAANSWRGSFHFDDAYMKIGQGVYRHINRQNDWGYHYLSILDNGDISVQWENVSAAQGNKGALVWFKRP